MIVPLCLPTQAPIFQRRFNHLKTLLLLFSSLNFMLRSNLNFPRHSLSSRCTLHLGLPPSSPLVFHPSLKASVRCLFLPNSTFRSCNFSSLSQQGLVFTCPEHPNLSICFISLLPFNRVNFLKVRTVPYSITGG